MDPVGGLASRIAALADDRDSPVVVAVDGRSGSGKSTLAKAVGALTAAVVIDGDDFYAGGTLQEWRGMSRAQRADHCIDWRRQLPIVEALRRGERAAWRPYDWEADDGTLADTEVIAAPQRVVILEGVYSARPELRDLVDITVLVNVPREECEQRVRRREGEHYREEWEALWSSAEDHYFTRVMRPEDFDVVLDTTGDTSRGS